MSQLINEILLRLAKLVVAGLLGAVVYGVAVTFQPGSFELALLCWVAAGVALLLLESSWI